MGDEMRVLLLLLLASIGAATTHTFDTEYIPGQHSVILAWTCDDRVDSQFVNLSTEYGFSMTFSPYNNFITDINDDFDGDPYYDEWVIGWAKNLGMDFGIHAQENAVPALAAGGRDSIETIWAKNAAFVARWSGVQASNTGFVWVGHNNSPELRAMAKARGFDWTRGNAGPTNPDLYLNGGGWSDKANAKGFYPPIMYHKSLVPSCSMYRLNTSGSSFPHVSTAADSAGWWAGTRSFLDSLDTKNGMAILNVHPGWTVSTRETVSQDSAFTRNITVPNGNKIILRGRQGNTGRNDVSAYQIAYILEAMAHWDSLKLSTEGFRRICILNMTELMADPNIPFRTDDTDDPDIALDATFTTADSTAMLADPTLEYSGDPELIAKEDFTVYVDGTGDVQAGNGTAAYPLPFGAWPYLFNCTVEFTGHAVGDTLRIKNGIDIPNGNVIYDLNGLTLMPTTTGIWLKYLDAVNTEAKPLLRNIEWHDGTFDLGGLTSQGVSVGDVASLSVQIHRPTRVTFKGITFKNGTNMLWAQNVNAMVVDSCFFSQGAVTAATSQYIGGSGLYRPVIRNSVFNLTGAANSSYMIDFGSSATLTWEDSIAVVNNVFITGTGTHYAFRIRAQADLDSTTIGRQIRLGGNYFVSNKSASPTTLVSHAAMTTIASLENSISINEPTFVDHRNYYRGAGTGFNALTYSSDTLRFGGSTCWAANTDNGNAWVGPSKFGYLPLLWTSGAVMGRPAAGTLQGPWEALLLVNNGVLTTSSATDTDTWFQIPRIYDESSLAVARTFLDAWEKWPAAAQAKVRFKVSGEPIAVIRSADSTYQTLGQLDAAITAAAETAADSLTASTWFTLDRPYNLNAAFQIEILRAWHRTLAEANRKKIRFRVAGTDFSMTDTDSVYSQGLWGLLADIGTGATASDSLNADTWFMAPRVYDMAQAQQFGIYEDAWKGWPLATQKKIRVKTK